MNPRTSTAVWEGTLREGKGVMKTGSGAFQGSYSFTTRFEDEPGTNPEELIAAAHAGCFSMALSGALTKAGFKPTRIETNAKVVLTKDDVGFKFEKIVLTTEATVPGIDEATFQQQAEGAKKNCPVSRALAAVQIELKATLKS